VRPIEGFDSVRPLHGRTLTYHYANGTKVIRKPNGKAIMVYPDGEWVWGVWCHHFDKWCGGHDCFCELTLFA
jgi:hypothetical protein